VVEAGALLCAGGAPAGLVAAAQAEVLVHQLHDLLGHGAPADRAVVLRAVVGHAAGDGEAGEFVARLEAQEGEVAVGGRGAVVARHQRLDAAALEQQRAELGAGLLPLHHAHVPHQLPQALGVAVDRGEVRPHPAGEALGLPHVEDLTVAAAEGVHTGPVGQLGQHLLADGADVFRLAGGLAVAAVLEGDHVLDGGQPEGGRQPVEEAQQHAGRHLGIAQGAVAGAVGQPVVAADRSEAARRQRREQAPRQS
jgi:hypothetical protein